MLRFKLILILAYLICLLIPVNENPANACENMVVTVQGHDWTDWYDPCGTRLRWTYKFTKISDGSPQVMIIIQGAGIERELDSGPLPYGPGQFSETANFLDGYDHRALVDFQPTINIPGFAAGSKLIIEYFPDQPE